MKHFVYIISMERASHWGEVYFLRQKHPQTQKKIYSFTILSDYAEKFDTVGEAEDILSNKKEMKKLSEYFTNFRIRKMKVNHVVTYELVKED